MIRPNRLVRACSAGAVTIAALSLAACGSAANSGTEAGVPAIAANAALHAGLPDDVRAAGVLHIVTDASYPPASSFGADGRTIVGFEPDLGDALGKVLGVRVEFSDEDFAELPKLVRADKADLIMSAMTDTPERGRQLDFVDYFSAGTSLVVQRSNPSGISDLRSLCGQRVSVEKDTIQYDLLKREQKQCGTSPITLLPASTNDDALLLLRTGRVAAVPMDFPPAELLTSAQRTSDQYQLASTEQYEPGPYGIGVSKDRLGLRNSVRAALAELIRTGAYHRILAKWGVESGGVRRAGVNLSGG